MQLSKRALVLGLSAVVAAVVGIALIFTQPAAYAAPQKDANGVSSVSLGF
jgi:hypothetical protein